MRAELSVADLFAGAGGFSLGFYLADFRIIAALDHNPWRKETYTSNIKVEKFILADVREFDFSLFYGADVLIAGPPCRPYSRANRLNSGSSHPDYGLESLFAEAALEVKPKVAVMEEVVSRLLNIGEVKRNLKRGGFSCKHLIVDFSEFGVPQLRRRVLLVASRGLPAEAIIGRLAKFKCSAPAVKDAFGDLPLKPTYVEECKVNGKGWLRPFNGILLNHECSRHKEDTLRLMRVIPPGYNLKMAAKAGFLPPKLAEAANRRHSYKYRRLEADKPAPTLTHPRASMILHPAAHRILTVRETARIQSFPDWFRFKGSLDEKYRQVVDAVPPKFSLFLAQSIVSALHRRSTCQPGTCYTAASWGGILQKQNL